MDGIKIKERYRHRTPISTTHFDGPMIGRTITFISVCESFITVSQGLFGLRGRRPRMSCE